MSRPPVASRQASPAQPEQCTVGEMARLAKCTVRAVRFYEQQGLLCCTERTDGHHRRYSSAEAERLRAIIALRRAGISLTAIRQLFGARTNRTTGADAAQHLSVALERQISILSAKLDHINAIKSELEHLSRTIEVCKGCHVPSFPSACVNCRLVEPSDQTATGPLWSPSK